MSTTPRGSESNNGAVNKVEIVDLQECMDDTFILPNYFQQHANSVENGTVQELNDGQLTTATTVVVVNPVEHETLNSTTTDQTHHHSHHHLEEDSNHLTSTTEDDQLNDENEDEIQTIRFKNGTRILSPNDRTETEEDRRSHLKDKDDG